MGSVFGITLSSMEINLETVKKKEKKNSSESIVCKVKYEKQNGAPLGQGMEAAVDEFDSWKKCILL